MKFLRSSLIVAGLLAAATPAVAQEIEHDARRMREIVITSINKYRASKGAKPITISGPLSAVAVRYAKFIGAEQNRGGHNADGSNSAARIEAYPYKACKTGENVAEITNWPNIMPLEQAADLVVKNWIASSRHEKNLSDPAFTVYGFASVARQYGDKKTYKFVHVFADDCGTEQERIDARGKRR